MVHGIKRRASSPNTQRVDHIYQDIHVDNAKFILHYGDLTDSSNLTRILQEVQPDEVPNLGAQSHVAVSFESPEYTAEVGAMGTLRLLEAIRLRKENAFLSSINVRVIWLGTRNTANRNNSVLSTFALCRGKNVCLLDHR